MAENLLTQIFDWEEDTLEWIKLTKWFLSYNELLFLEIVFSLEPERFNKINLVSDLEWWYNSLQDSKSRKLFLEIINKLYTTLSNKTSLSIIKNFLEDHKNYD